MNAPQLDTVRVLRGFGETGARVVLIGGMAAVTLGIPYLTQDIDFCYDTAPENHAKLIVALAPLLPRLRVEGLPDDIAGASPRATSTGTPACPLPAASVPTPAMPAVAR
jgi:hypothetical protein